MKHADRNARSERSRSLPRLAIGISFLVTVGAGALVGLLPAVIAIGYVVMSGFSYLMYMLDKDSARRGRRRTPESTLHAADLLGGWPGALVAQQQARHKTAKASYPVVFWLTVIGNLAGVAWLVHAGAFA